MARGGRAASRLAEPHVRSWSPASRLRRASTSTSSSSRRRRLSVRGPRERRTRAARSPTGCRVHAEGRARGQAPHVVARAGRRPTTRPVAGGPRRARRRRFMCEIEALVDLVRPLGREQRPRAARLPPRVPGRARRLSRDGALGPVARRSRQPPPRGLRASAASAPRARRPRRRRLPRSRGSSSTHTETAASSSTCSASACARGRRRPSCSCRARTGDRAVAERGRLRARAGRPRLVVIVPRLTSDSWPRRSSRSATRGRRQIDAGRRRLVERAHRRATTGRACVPRRLPHVPRGVVCGRRRSQIRSSRRRAPPRRARARRST